MKKTNAAFLLGLSAMMIGQLAFAADPVVSIPLKTFINPTFDLMDQNGIKQSSSDLDAKFRQGVDLSKFNPAENNYWQNQKYAATDAKLYAEMPNAETGEVVFSQSLGAYREAQLYSIIVSPKENANVRYGLTFGLQIHSSLVKAALLRKLGIYQESPKYYHKMKVRFASAEEMNNFITTAFNVEGSKEDNIDYLSLEPFQRGIISDVNKSDNTLILHGSYLEKMNPSVPSLFDGLTPATNDSLSLFAKSRAFRSLVIPYVIGDLQESLNRVSTQSASLRGGSVELNFVNNFYFKDKTSEADAKWILRLIANLTDQDWNEIVAAGSFPPQLAPLVKMKLMYRTKNMMENFFSPEERAQIFKVAMPALSVNTGNGCVVDSKVMPICANIPGYPQRWSHGDRQSPFETSDLIRYVGIKAQASTLKEALGKLSEKVQKTKTTFDIKGIQFTDQGINPLGSAQSIAGGLSYTADRIITTGTYYGSQAPVQLVDNVSITGSLAYQKLGFLKDKVVRNFGANIGYNRDYTYVTPIQTTKEAKQQSWGNLFFESKLNNLVKPLEDGNNLTKFLTNLKQGEVFTITDSVGLMGRAGISKTIDNLIGFTSFATPTISLSGDISENIILRQTQFIRTAEGIQVFLRDGNALSWGVQFDADYFINLLKIRYQTTSTDLHTEAYLISYNSELMAKVDSGELTGISDELQKVVDAQAALSQKGAQAILALVNQSNSSPIRENFKYQRYEITHGLKTTEIQKSLLWFRSTKMDEEHILTVYKPEMVAPPGSTVINKALQFSLYQKGELKGSDKFGFGLNILDAAGAKYIGKNSPSISQNAQNPSQMPYGKAYWRMIRSDSDLSTDRATALKSVATIDHVWSGWSIKKEALQAVIQELRDSLKNIKIAANATIPDGALYHTKKIDFYRITSHLTLLPEAIDAIKNIILAPEAADLKLDKPRFIARFFQKLSELGGNKARAQDKVVYNNIMRILGNGDETKGQQAYLEACRTNTAPGGNNSEGSQTAPVSTWSKGTNYECLEAWTEKLIKLSRNYPKDDVRAQNRWMSDVLFVIDEKIPQGYLLNELGADKFIYYIDFAGFRVGDEDGDDGVYTPFVLGEPTKKSDYGNGLVSLLSGKFKIVPTELMTTRLSAQ